MLYNVRAMRDFPKEREGEILEFIREGLPYVPCFTGTGLARLAIKVNRIYDHFKKRHGVVISAFKMEETQTLPNGTETVREISLKENLERSHQLARRIREMGYGYAPTLGMWKDPETGIVSYEQSYLVPMMTLEDGLKLGREFDQYGIIYFEKGKWGLYEAKTGNLEVEGTQFHVIYGESPFVEELIEKKRGSTLPNIYSLEEDYEERVDEKGAKYRVKVVRPKKVTPAKNWFSFLRAQDEQGEEGEGGGLLSPLPLLGGR